MATNFRLFKDSVFNAGTLIDPVDLFTGDGTTTTFALVNKSGSSVGNTIVVGSTLLFRSQGDFTVVGDNIVFAVAPANDAVIVVPGLINLLSGVIFDTADGIPGVTDANTLDIAFWAGDYISPDVNSYVAAPGQSGVLLSVVALNSGIDVTADWTQLAESLADGTPDTFASPAVPLITSDFSGSDLVTANASIADTTLLVADTSNFLEGDYIKIGTGTSSVEIRQIVAIVDPTTLTVAPLNFNHVIGETVFTSHRKFWLRITVPEGATAGEAINLYNLAVQRIYVVLAK